MKFSIRESRLVSVGFASVVAVGVIGFGGAAFAQDAGQTPTMSLTMLDGGTANMAEGAPGELAPTMALTMLDSGTTAPPAPHAGIGKGLAIASIIRNAGVMAEEIAEGKAAGLTWGQILDQYGDITAAEAKQQALDALKARLDEAVANGRITQEKADQRLADASTKIDEFLNSQPGDKLPGDGHFGKGLRGFREARLETIAGVLGMDVETLRSELASGKTVAEIAGSQTQAVIDALVAAANAKIDEAVASGRITEERAAELKTTIQEKVTRFVNEGGPLKGLGKGPKGTSAPSSSTSPTQ